MVKTPDSLNDDEYHVTGKATSCNLNPKFVFGFDDEYVHDDKNDGHLSKLDRRGPAWGSLFCNLNPAKTDRPLVASNEI